MHLLSLLQANPAAFIACAALFALVIGSFLNVVIYRLPIMMEREWKSQCRELLGTSESNEPSHNEQYNLVIPRSRCPGCDHLITAIDNIPVVSYLLLRGRCRNCGQKISPRYPLIELLCCILTAFLAWHFGFDIRFLLAAVLTWSLICLSFIDLDHRFLPDDITLPVMWLGIIVNMFGIFTDIHSSLLGAILGYTILWLIFIVFRLLTGKEGMGYGDFKLLAMLGAWVGWQHLPFIILASSLLGVFTGVSQMLFSGKDRNNPFPFGPSLALAGWIALIWGHEINHFYLTFYQ